MKYFLTSFLILAVSLTGGNLQAKNSSRLLAKVNERIVLKSDIKARARLLSVVRGRPVTVNPASHKEILESLIQEAVILDFAQDRKINIEKSDFKDSEEQMSTSLGLTAKQLRKNLTNNKVSDKHFENFLKGQLVWQAFVSMQCTPQVKILPEDIKVERQKLNKFKQQDRARLFEISINSKKVAKGSTAKGEAYKAYDRIEKQQGFDRVAMSMSHAASGRKGGDIGWVDLSSLDQYSRNSVSKLSIGGYTKPIKTKNGYRILALVERHKPGSIGQTQTFYDFSQTSFKIPMFEGEVGAKRLFEQANSMRNTTKSEKEIKEFCTNNIRAETLRNKQAAKQMLAPELVDVLDKIKHGHHTPVINAGNAFIVFTLWGKQTIKPKEKTDIKIREELQHAKTEELSQRAMRDMKRAAQIERF